MKSRLMAGAAAVVLAIVGAMLVISYAQGADQRAVKNLEPVAVLVVKTAIPAGTPVESMTASVTTEQLPAAAVTGSSLKSFDESKGKVAAVDLVPGEQLVTERLVEPEELKTQGSSKSPQACRKSPSSSSQSASSAAAWLPATMWASSSPWKTAVWRTSSTTKPPS